MGNQGEVDVDTTPAGDSNCATATVDVIYTDKTGYFSDAGSINLWLRATNGTVLKLALKKFHSNPTKYSLADLNTVFRCLRTSEEGKGQLELAFADSSWTKWDSNNAKNYVVTAH